MTGSERSHASFVKQLTRHPHHSILDTPHPLVIQNRVMNDATQPPRPPRPHQARPTLHSPPLRRFDRVWAADPIFFITTNVNDRRPLLACDDAHAIIKEVFETGQHLHRWKVGSYMIMPDHVHFFCSACRDSETLHTFVGKGKEWTSKFFKRRLGWEAFAWQHRFHDHLLRSDESYSEKWEYVRMNPVRAGLVNDADEWRFRGRLNVF